jgi:glucose/arabinose dehydrogenase
MRVRVGPCLAFVGLALLSCGGCGGESSAPDPSAEDASEPPRAELRLDEVGTFEEPIALTEAPGGGFLVGERAGLVRSFEPGDGEVAEVVLDLSREVSTEGEGGLFSLAASPEGEEVFVSYSGRDKRLHLEAFTPRADPERAARTRREILSVDHPNEVHWGGDIAFDRDGLLYFSVGEGGPVAPRPVVSQDPDSLLGKLLRIDPRGGEETAYAVPDSNPLVGREGRDEVFALGLRNPWQFSIDGKDIWIGDVGDFQQEEIDLASTDAGKALNFGWPILEGTAKTGVEDEGEPLEGPALTYERTGKPDDPNCAVTGGHVVRDPSLEPLVGRYIYADFCRGEIYAAKPSKGGLGRPEPTGLILPRVVSFAQDAEGHSYAVALDGTVARIVHE